jgi:hypothetical protein
VLDPGLSACSKLSRNFGLVSTASSALGAAGAGGGGGEYCTGVACAGGAGGFWLLAARGDLWALGDLLASLRV